MIIIDKLSKPYEQVTIRTKVDYQCDYCGAAFLRDKKSRERLNLIINKDSCGNKACTQAKREEVFLKQHGNKNIFATNLFKGKQAQTNVEKYGTEEYFASDDFQQKRKKTLIETLGVENPMQSEVVRQRQEQTTEERHGVRNYSQHQDFLPKRDKTNTETYGEKSVMQVEKFKNKKDETCEKIYGHKSYTQTEEYWIDRKAKCLVKKGVEHESQLKENRDKAKQTCVERYGEDNYSKTEEFKQKCRDIWMEHYGVPNPLFLPENQVYGKTQNDIADWLNFFGFNFKLNCILLDDRRQIDIYDEKEKLAIEYCGLFWHTDLSHGKRDETYHYGKYIECNKKGIALITMFEDEWKSRNAQCKSILLSYLGKYEQQIKAIMCDICELTEQEFNVFCDSYHLQGGSNHGVYFCGMKYNGELVGAISIGIDQDKNMILDRVCFKHGVQVIGGENRLLFECLKHMKLAKLVAWSDNRWGHGKVYESMGFKVVEELPPEYEYVNLAKPYKRSYPAIKIEEAQRIEQKIGKIWNCGKTKWALIQ